MLYKYESQRKRDSWRGWISKATEGSASMAHALSKRLELPPLILAEAQQAYPRNSGITKDTSAMSVLNEAHTKWKELWDSPDHTLPEWHDVVFPQPVLRTIKELRKTAKSFKNKNHQSRWLAP